VLILRRNQRHLLDNSADDDTEKGTRHMKNLIAQFVRDEQGQDLIEYALLAGFISLAVVTAVTQVGTSLNTLYGNVKTQINTAAS